jgi:hypothetical protein
MSLNIVTNASTASPSSASAVKVLTGHRLTNALRGLRGAGRTHLALAIVEGRTKLDALTPTQICRVCEVPAGDRGLVRRRAAKTKS